MGTPIVSNQIFNAQAITQNNAEEVIVPLERSNFEGFFSLQIELTGAGNVDITYALSNSGDDYITPAAAVDIFSAFGVGSGPGTDGKDIASFDPMLHQFLKIIATEQNAGAVVLTAWLAVQ